MTARAFDTAYIDSELPAADFVDAEGETLAVAIDRLVPQRTGWVAKDVELRAAFVLLHVDDRSSVAQIAYLAGLPIDEVVKSIFELLALGVVDFEGVPAANVSRASGVYARVLPGT